MLVSLPVMQSFDDLLTDAVAFHGHPGQVLGVRMAKALRERARAWGLENIGVIEATGGMCRLRGIPSGRSAARRIDD